MASSPVTAPSSSDSNSPPTPPSSSSPPPSDDSSSSPPPPSNDNSSSAPPPSDDSSLLSPPAPTKHSPPPSQQVGSSPPPPTTASSPPPAGSQTPPSQNNPPSSSTPPPNSSSSPPSNNSPPSPPSDDSPSSPPSDDSSSSPPSGGTSTSPPSGGSSTSPPSGGSSSSPPSGGSSSTSPSGGSSSSPPPPTSTMTPPSSPSNTPTPSGPKALSPPSHKESPSHSKGDSEASTKHHQSDVNVPLVVGITAGIGLFFILMIVVFVCCTKKKRRPRDGMHYYVEPSHGGARIPKGSDYYSSGQNWQMMDHVVKLPPPPGAMGQPGGGWHPPPPPVTMSSSDMSSAYSGPHGPPLPPPSPNLALGFSKSTFTYEELAAATNGFSQANLLGQGGFGYVHKGVLPNGKDIAVKQLKSGSGQGEREFQAEVEIISRVHHRHLVSLVGYCIAGEQRMLVYEFVANKTLEFHLYGKDRPVMDFPTRLKIALGSAKGLAYLHEDCHPRIIHRDIKAANILLDYKFEAMVADFGLAKLSSDNYTHVSTRVMGTFGYLAPEYASSGKLTEKSDVFSFGVMLLELITGRRPVDNTHTFMEDSLVDWARPIITRALNDGNFDELIDPRLEGNYNPTEMARLAACAAASVRHSARKRPKMSQVVRALEGDSSLEDLDEGIKPGHSSAFGSPESSEKDTSSSYTSEMRRFQRVALASQEFGSSEYGATSDYGLNPSASSSEYGNSRETNTNTTGNQRRGL